MRNAASYRMTTTKASTELPAIPFSPRLVGGKNVEERFGGSSCRNRLLDRSLAAGFAFLSEELLTTESLGVRVESEQDGFVSKGILLLGEWACKSSANADSRKSSTRTLLDGLSLGSDNRLDLVRVDDSGNVG